MTPHKGSDSLTRNRSEGKLHTVSTIQVDESSNKGVLIYALNELIDSIRENSEDFSFEEERKVGDYNSRKYTVTCSYFEIYNDLVYDLLSDIDDIDHPLMV